MSHKEVVVFYGTETGNSQDLADWLDSELIVSNWRPVSLEYATLAELDLEPRAIQQSQLTNSGPLNPPRTLSGPKSHISWAALSDVHEQEDSFLLSLIHI